jgi:hypothetical protein
MRSLYNNRQFVSGLTYNEAYDIPNSVWFNALWSSTMSGSLMTYFRISAYASTFGPYTQSTGLNAKVRPVRAF